MVYFPELHAEVCCVRLNFSRSKLGYWRAIGSLRASSLFGSHAGDFKSHARFILDASCDPKSPA